MFLLNLSGSVLVTVVASVGFKSFIYIVAVDTIGRMVPVKPEIFCMIES